MKAFVDPEVCVNCGICIDTCPEVFSMQATTVRAIEGEVPKHLEEVTRDAFEQCPVDAINIEG